jgi:hypothetical protein
MTVDVGDVPALVRSRAPAVADSASAARAPCQPSRQAGRPARGHRGGRGGRRAAGRCRSGQAVGFSWVHGRPLRRAAMRSAGECGQPVPAKISVLDRIFWMTPFWALRPVGPDRRGPSRLSLSATRASVSSAPPMASGRRAEWTGERRHAGGGTRTPDTRIMIPSDFGLGIGHSGRVGHVVGHNRRSTCTSFRAFAPAIGPRRPHSRCGAPLRAGHLARVAEDLWRAVRGTGLRRASARRREIAQRPHPPPSVPRPGRSARVASRPRPQRPRGQSASRRERPRGRRRRRDVPVLSAMCQTGDQTSRSRRDVRAIAWCRVTASSARKRFALPLSIANRLRTTSA